MKVYTSKTADPAGICDEMLNGKGAVLLRGLFAPDDISEARSIIMKHSEADAEKVTHFQGEAQEDGNLHLQRRVWNLLAKGDVFSRMATHPVILSILRPFLGTEFIMGSIAANRILPGGPGQEPHVDYPYWDYYKTNTHPMGLNSSFPMNAQVTILLDPFTVESGATAFVPGTQKDLRYPTDEDRFFDRCERIIGQTGDVAMFFGAVWHCAMPNISNFDRTAILIQYLPKWIKPLELTPRALPQEFVDNASDEMRQLLGFHFDYPEVLDDARAENTEGRQ